MADREPDYKRIIANNISELRKSLGLTQAELAQRLNYSDKAVSKWERGESIPDVVIMKKIADVFGVSIDYLMEAEHKRPVQPWVVTEQTRRNRQIIVGLSCMLVVLIATVLFVVLLPFPQFDRLWLFYVYSVPICAVICLVFNSIWGRKKLNFVIISILVWSLLASLYLSVGNYNSWQLFIVGVPAQIIIVLWSGIESRRGKTGNPEAPARKTE